MRSAQYEHGRRNGVKRCVEWLHERAAEMNDPHARAVLNSAAFSMGQQFKMSDGPLSTPSSERLSSDRAGGGCEGSSVAPSRETSDSEQRTASAWRPIAELKPDEDGYVIIAPTDDCEEIPEVWSANQYHNAMSPDRTPAFKHLHEAAKLATHFLRLSELPRLPK